MVLMLPFSLAMPTRVIEPLPIFYDAANALASTDVVSAWTRNNVAWAAAEGILTKTQTTNTTKNATRAEVATAIYTYLIKTAK